MQSRPQIKSVGLMGFGAFGRLVARHLAPLVPVIVHDPALNAAPPGLGSGDPAQVAACDLVILAVPVAGLEQALAAIAPHLRPGAIVADVGSVKLRPVQIMLRCLPRHVQIVGTHPLFGPQSAAGGVRGHKIAICRVRGDACLTLAALLRQTLGLRPHLVTAETHDREAAVVQGLTHFIAQAFARLDPPSARLTTASFERLCQAIDMVRNDPPGVFHAIERENPFSAPVRERFMEQALTLTRELTQASDEPIPSFAAAPIVFPQPSRAPHRQMP